MFCLTFSGCCGKSSLLVDLARYVGSYKGSKTLMSSDILNTDSYHWSKQVSRHGYFNEFPQPSKPIIVLKIVVLWFLVHIYQFEVICMIVYS